MIAASVAAQATRARNKISDGGGGGAGGAEGAAIMGINTVGIM